MCRCQQMIAAQMTVATTETGNDKVSAKTAIIPFPVVDRCRSCLDTLIELGLVTVVISILSVLFPEI